jgi:hypothetical protein
MGIGSFLGKTALHELLKHSPRILDAAAKLRHGRNGAEAEGLAQLEALMEEERAVVAALSDQLRLTTAALEEMRRRLTKVTILAGAALLLAAAAIAVALF